MSRPRRVRWTGCPHTSGKARFDVFHTHPEACCRKQGEEAFAASAPVSSCPFPLGDPKWEWWVAGWSAAPSKRQPVRDEVTGLAFGDGKIEDVD